MPRFERKHRSTRRQRLDAAGITCLTALLFLSLTLLGCPGRLDSLAQFGGAEENPLAFSHPDVHERMVSVGYPTDETVVLFFNGPATSDAMQPVTTEIAVEYRDADNIRFVNVVDLRPLSFYERPFAPNAIRGAHERTIRRINRRLDDRGYPPIEGLFDYLHIIADENGGIVEAYGVPNPNETITAIVFDQGGHELGRFNPEDELQAVIDTIAGSLDGQSGIAEADE